MKQYKAKSLAGAQRRVRQMQKQVDAWRNVAAQMQHERDLMAKLAADEPQFFNPLDFVEAKQIRNRILKSPNGESSDRESVTLSARGVTD